MQELNATYFKSVTDISPTIFKSLDCEKTLFYSQSFLTAFESTQKHIEHTYVVLALEQKPVALLLFQTFDVDVSQAYDKVPFLREIVNYLPETLHSDKRITICGNIFLSGNYGLFIKEDFNKAQIYQTLPSILERNYDKDQHGILFLKDFTVDEKNKLSTIEKQHFHPFEVEPNMLLELGYTDFENYKNALKSKYRVKLNKADSQSSDIKNRIFTSTEILQYAKELQSLYVEVVDNAPFNATLLDIRVYAELQERFCENFNFITYWKSDHLIGFATSFVVQGRLETHFIGMDYSLNKEHSLYPRMLNDYIRLGLEKGVDIVNFGRTASEMKSTVGAEPQFLHCYLKHTNPIVNIVLKRFLKDRRFTPYKQHKVFKKQK